MFSMDLAKQRKANSLKEKCRLLSAIDMTSRESHSIQKEIQYEADDLSQILG